MRKTILTILTVLLVSIGSLSFADEPNVYHIVLLEIKEGIPQEQIEDMMVVGKALLSDIPGVLDVSINKKAREDRNVHIKDYDIGICVIWENLKTGGLYAPHVLHQTFIKLYQPMFQSIRVIDFYGNEKTKSD